MEGKKMAEATKKKESRIKTWWTGVKAEFSRIICCTIRIRCYYWKIRIKNMR